MYQYCYGSSFNKNLLVVLASFFHLADADGDDGDDYEGYYHHILPTILFLSWYFFGIDSV